MMAALPLWDFTDHVEARRRELMLAVPDWDAVRRMVMAHQPTEVSLEVRKDPYRVGGAGAQRASVRIAMPPDNADAFYNSPVGLRAQYCLGSGTKFSRELIDALVPACAAMFGADRQRAEQSLRGKDAKLCLAKDDIPNSQEIHIDYAPWVAWVDRGERLANTGVLAPQVEAIWVKGAWIDKGKEWPDPEKVGRDEKFRDYGFG